MSRNSIPMSDQGEEEDKDSFHLLFFHHPLPMWIYDLETLVFLEVNDAAMNKYGYTRAEFLSMSLADIHPVEEVSRLLEDVRRKRPALSHAGEWRHCLKDGTIIDVDITSLKIVFKGCQAALVTAQDITEPKQGEQERNLLAHMLTNSLDEIYLFDADSLRFRFVNRGALNNLQFSLDQMQRMTPLDIKPELDIELFERLLEPLRRGEKQAQVFETVHRRADGTLYPVEVHLQWFGDQGVFLAVILDITKRVQAEEALRESEARFATIFHANPGAVALTRLEDNRLVDVNTTWLEITGYTRAEAIGHSPLELNLWVDVAQREQLVEAIRQHGKARSEMKIRRKTGEARDLLMSAEQVELAGKRYLLTMAQDITERKQAEQALQESEERHRQISTLMSDYVYYGQAFPDGRAATEWVTGAFERITGYTPDEVNRLPQGFSTLLVPEDLERVIRQQSIFFEKGSFTTEYRIRRKDGEIRWLRDSMQNMKSEGLGKPAMLLGAVKDITEQKHAEAEILQGNEDLALLNTINNASNQGESLDSIINLISTETKRIFNSNGVTLHLLDEHGALVMQTFPLSPKVKAKIEKLIGQPIPPVAHDLSKAHPYRQVLESKQGRLITDSAQIQEFTAAYLEAAPWTEKTCKRVKRVIPSLMKFLGYQSIVVAPLIYGDSLFGTLDMGSRNVLTETDLHRLETIASQLTAVIQRKRAEEKVAVYTENLEEMVEERTRELREAQEQLVRQERLAVMGQLAGGVGHELRNPLGVINNAVYYLRLVQPEADEKVREYLGIIEAEARNADKIITDLLDFSRTKSVELEPISARDLLARTLKRFPAPRGVRVTLELPDNLPLAYVDARQIIQVLGNLAVNACQSMRGKGKLDLSARVKKREGRAYLAIAVRDNGPGIPPENMDKLFEPLFTTRPKGIGLGLAVSQKLAEANQGWIEVASQAGKGATFTLYLPTHEGGT